MISSRARSYAAAALVSGLILAAWAGGLTHGLQCDDMHLLREYLKVQDRLPPVYRYFMSPSWEYYYRPLGAYFSDRVFALFWPTVWPMRLVAFGIHALGALAVGRLGRTCGLRPGAAWCAAAIFATAPARAEPVLWLATLHGTLENVLSLWATVCLVEGRRGSWRPWMTAAGVLLFLCAITTKESGLIVLGVLMTHDLLWRAELSAPARRVRGLAAVYGPMVAGTAAVLLARHAAYGGFRIFTLNTMDWGYVTAATVRAMLATFAPMPWAPVEGILTPFARTFAGRIVIPLGVVALVGAAAARRSRVTVWLWLCFGGALLPLASAAIVPAERHLYLASAFAALLLATAGNAVLAGGTRWRGPVAAAAVVWLTTQVIFARQRERAWGDAADHVRAVLEQTDVLVPNVTEDTLLLYLGVPDMLDGALVFRFGNLGDFLRARYGLTTMQAHMMTTPAELPTGLLEAPGALRFTISARGGLLYWPDSMHGGPYAAHDQWLPTYGKLGRSYLLFDWLRAGNPAHVLVYDAASQHLRLGDDALRADVADKLLSIDYTETLRISGPP